MRGRYFLFALSVNTSKRALARLLHPELIRRLVPAILSAINL